MSYVPVQITDVEGAALRLGVSQARVRQLDDVLRPARIGRDGRRVYLVAALDHYAAERDARKASR